MKITNTEKIIMYLKEELGSKEVKYNSHKYRKFTTLIQNTFYFIGKRGAVRIGKVSSESFSVTDRIHQKMKEWWDEKK